jgi:DNA replication protein DnaC
MHGLDGSHGLWATKHAPKQYDHCRLTNLPDIKPDKVRKGVGRYIKNVLEYVDEGTGLFLFGLPTSDNKLGTGTGKTTSAITILNEFIIARASEHLRGDKLITANPAYFIRVSTLQNVYNSQFRGSIDAKEQASLRYYSLKKAIIDAELTIFDDIAVRTATETFVNELYEIIDTRVTECRASIYTSNIPPDELAGIYGDRILSRIQGSCVLMPFMDKDWRKGGLSL